MALRSICYCGRVLTNLRVADRLLEPLRHLQRLRVLECANLFAPGEMERLRLNLSGTRCSWFDLIEEYGSTRAGKEAVLKKLRDSPASH